MGSSSSFSTKQGDRKIQHGFLLCFLIAAMMDDRGLAEVLREITMIANQEREFSDLSPEQFESLLSEVQKDLHLDPEKILAKIKSLLPEGEARVRALELTIRVVTSDGILAHDERAYLRKIAENLNLDEEQYGEAVTLSQTRLARFMFIYLVYLTATADEIMRVEEFEQMIPRLMKLPVFSGITTEQFSFISHSVRSHLESMKGEKGLEYICKTLLKASELLGDETIPLQALQLCSVGVFADQKLHPKESDFIKELTKHLGIPQNKADQVIADSI